MCIRDQCDVVLEDESGMRASIGREERAALKRGVVIDRYVSRPIEQLEEAPRSPGPTDVHEQVVAESNAAGLLAGVVIVVPEDVDPASHPPDHVVREDDVFDD